MQKKHRNKFSWSRCWYGRTECERDRVLEDALKPGQLSDIADIGRSRRAWLAQAYACTSTSGDHDQQTSFCKQPEVST